MSIVDEMSTFSNLALWDLREIEASILHGELVPFDDWPPSILVKNERRVFLILDLSDTITYELL